MNSAAVNKAMPKAVRKDLSSHLNEARTSLQTIEAKFIEATCQQTGSSFERHFEQCFASALSQFEQTLERLVRDDGETLLAWTGSEVTPDRARFVEALIENNGEKLINAARRRAPRMLRGACEGIALEKDHLLAQVLRQSILRLPEQVASSDLVHQPDHSIEEPPAYRLGPGDEPTLVVTVELKIADRMRVVLKRAQTAIVAELTVLPAASAAPSVQAKVSSDPTVKIIESSRVTQVHLSVEGTSAASVRETGEQQERRQESARGKSRGADESEQAKRPHPWHSDDYTQLTIGGEHFSVTPMAAAFLQFLDQDEDAEGVTSAQAKTKLSVNAVTKPYQWFRRQGGSEVYRRLVVVKNRRYYLNRAALTRKQS